MAEETHPKPSEAEVVVADAAAAAPPPAAESTSEPPAAATEEAVAESTSFKEESNIVEDPEKKALDELKQLIHSALSKNDFVPPPPLPPASVEEPPAKDDEEAPKPPAVEPEKAEETTAAPPEPPKSEEPAPPAEEKAVIIEEDGAKTVEATADPEFIWGIPLSGDEKSDTILLKFLRARDFKVKDAMAMLKSAVIWRKQFGIEGILAEDLGVPPELEKVVFMQGYDKESHPVCYNVYGEFQDKELYGKAFGDEEKREKFLKWRIQFLEKGIREQLDFAPGAVNTMVQVTDLKNVPGPGKSELRQATKKALALLQDNYPEFVAKQIFINVPWWYLAYNRIISSIFTPRSKSKFVFAGPSRSSETLFKYIAPEQVPVQYGGLSIENNPDFTTADAVTEVTIKPSSKETIEIAATEIGLLVWEFRVLEWEVSYGAEFVPSAEGKYTVIVTKARKLIATDEPVVKNSFKIDEPGKVVLTIDNATSKKKKLLYRSKVKSTNEST